MNHDIFCQFGSKLAISHTFAIKLMEKYDVVVVDCPHSFGFCDDRMKMSLPEKKKLLGRLTLLPGSHLERNFSP